MPTEPRKPTNAVPPEHKETFDVILLRKGKHEWDAMPDDVKRVRVEATSTLQAQWHPDVEKETDFAPAEVVPFDYASPIESAIQTRVSILERSKT